MIYHIYPLGLCNAPKQNNFYSQIQHRINYLYEWIEHIKNLGTTIVYLGPLFESSSHGYDTYDYYHVDRRLGDRESLAKLIHEFHRQGIKVIVDGVFNHVGRDFWAFRDILKNGKYSWYCDWFQGLTFEKRSPFGDSFSYKSWKNHYSLVKLNLNNKYVKEHLFKAVEMWINELGIDGLRLDAADCLKVGFIRDLKKFSKKIKHDFILIGEVVHGDYRKRANEKMLDSITNYQCYHEIYKSFNHKNFSEISHKLNKKFGEHGIYKNLNLYNFVDNHDVNRIGSVLKNKDHIYPLYSLLFTMPGTPSIYYGSEFLITGKKTRYDDYPLRPFLELSKLYKKNSDLVEAIKKFSYIRNHSEALKHGSYKELFVHHQLFAFARFTHKEYIIVIINSSEYTEVMEFIVPHINNAYAIDILNNNERFIIQNHKIKVYPLWKNWTRVLKVVLN